jgi:hypothetical protein
MNDPANPVLVGKPERQPAVDGKRGTASAAYKKAFWNQLRGYTSYEVRNALQVGELAEGGYTVPDEFEHQLIEALQDENIMRGLVHVISTSSGDRKIPLVTNYGTASWIEEEAQIPESDVAFNQITLGAHKLATAIRISQELLNDSAFDLASFIAHEFQRRAGAAEEEAILAGDGSVLSPSTVRTRQAVRPIVPVGPTATAALEPAHGSPALDFRCQPPSDRRQWAPLAGGGLCQNTRTGQAPAQMRATASTRATAWAGTAGQPPTACWPQTHRFWTNLSAPSPPRASSGRGGAGRGSSVEWVWVAAALTQEVQRHHVAADGRHLEAGRLPLEGPAVLVHRAGPVQPFARGHAACGGAQAGQA